MAEMVVRAGAVNSIKRVTCGVVASVLGHIQPGLPPTLHHPLNSAAAQSVLIEPSSPARQTNNATLFSNLVALTDLTLLHKLSTALAAHQTRDDALHWHMPRASPTVTDNVEQHQHHTPSSPTFYHNQPAISLMLTFSVGEGRIGPAPQSSPAQLLLSELMILANRSAARFAAQRGLALPYVSPQLDALPAQLEAVLALGNPLIGKARGKNVLRQGLRSGAARLGSSPGRALADEEQGRVRACARDQDPAQAVPQPARPLAAHKCPAHNCPTAKAQFHRTRVSQITATVDNIGKQRGKVDSTPGLLGRLLPPRQAPCHPRARRHAPQASTRRYSILPSYKGFAFESTETWFYWVKCAASGEAFITLLALVTLSARPPRATVT